MTWRFVTKGDVFFCTVMHLQLSCKKIAVTLHMESYRGVHRRYLVACIALTHERNHSITI